MLPPDELSITRYNLDRFCFGVISDEFKLNSTMYFDDKQYKVWEKREL